MPIRWRFGTMHLILAALAVLSVSTGPLGAEPPTPPGTAPASWRSPAGVAAMRTTTSPPLAIVGGTILTVTRGVIPGGTLLVLGGKISALGVGLPIPSGATVVDAHGRFVMPGLIDTHSHMGVAAWPDSHAHDDVNEATDPLTPQMRAEDAIHLEDPAFDRARAGGVTTVQIIPGSANLQGGLAAILKLRRVNTLDEMKLAAAPRGIKMAFGENPKRVYGSKGRVPSTRMGNAALLREAFTAALEYRKQGQDFEANSRAGKPTVRPAKDLRAETLLEVLDGRVRVHWHCYRKDDLLALMRVADEFKFRIASFEHCLEGYKLAAELARRDIGVCTWPDWWGFKMEARDGIPEAPGILANAGVRVALHSDSATTVQFLFMEAAKAIKYGLRREHALKTITLWPATILGIEEHVGSLEVGKDADLAIFTRHPFDVYTTVEKTFIDGVLVHDATAKEDAQ